MDSHAAAEFDASKVGTLGQVVSVPAQAIALGGAIALVLAAALGFGTDKAHFWHAYLVNVVYFLSLGLGALIFVVLQHLTRSGWSVMVRRVMEIISLAVMPCAILFLPILISVVTGDASLFPWNDPEIVKADEIVAHKTGYSNPIFFACRAVFYFVVWSGIAWYFLKTSSRQDETGDPKLSLRMEGMAAPAVILYALTSSFAAIDWIMTLDEYWFSTILGVYFFAASIVGFGSLLAILVIHLQDSGVLGEGINAEHFHDLGKVIFFGTCFWGYIALSQYLLIWYANIPEETMWYQVRQENGWQWISMILILGHFAIPFLGMMPRDVKRNPKRLLPWAIFMLVMCWIDIYWLIMPQYDASVVPFSLVEVLCFLGVGGVVVGVVLHLAADYTLMPVGDPRLPECLDFHNI